MRQTDKEYAYALFELSYEEGTVDKTLGELLAVKEAILENPRFTELLSSPAVPMSERLSILDEVFGAHLSEYTLSFLKLLCEAGRAGMILDCVDEYVSLEREISGKIKVKIISATPLSDEQKEALISKLEKTEKKKIDPEYTVDPSIMGGLIVRTADKIYDGSVKNRLGTVKEVMMR